MNLNRYVGNGATNATDPSGNSPNRRNARELKWLVKIVEEMEAKYPQKKPQEILNVVQNSMCWRSMNAPLNVQNGLIDKKPPSKGITWGYIYTEKHGWIDLGHFFTNARGTLRHSDLPDWMLMAAGIAYEEWSYSEGKKNPKRPGIGSSAFTPEDLISNKLGIQFGRAFDDKATLSKQLEKFFEPLKPRSPSNAWNFVYLPRDEVLWEMCWRNYPEIAMKNTRIILNRNDNFWKQWPPDSEEMLKRAKEGRIWGPLLRPPSRHSK